MLPDELIRDYDLLTPYAYNPGRVKALAANKRQQFRLTAAQHDLLIVGWNGSALSTGMSNGADTLLNVTSDDGQNWFENPLSFTTIFGDQENSAFTLARYGVHYLHMAFPLPAGRSLTVTIYAGASGADYAEVTFWCVAFRARSRVPVAV